MSSIIDIHYRDGDLETIGGVDRCEFINGEMIVRDLNAYLTLRIPLASVDWLEVCDSRRSAAEPSRLAEPVCGRSEQTSLRGANREGVCDVRHKSLDVPQRESV